MKTVHFSNYVHYDVVNTEPLKFSYTLSRKTLADKNLVQRKHLLNEHYIYHKKKNAELNKTLVRQKISEGLVCFFILQPWLGFLETVIN